MNNDELDVMQFQQALSYTEKLILSNHTLGMHPDEGEMSLIY